MTLVETDPLQTVRGMAEELGVSSDAVFDGLKRIGKVKNLESSKARKVGASQFERSTEIVTFRGLFFFAFGQQNDLFLDQVVTCDEMWIL